MHVCIVGTGATGWIAAHFLNEISNIKKITIIGSDKIPTIGVGESTTHSFREFALDTLKLDGKDYIKFLIDIDAAFKYGVMYKNWSKKDFLHPFAVGQHTGYLLGKKDPTEKYLKYVSPLHEVIENNKVYLGKSNHEYSFHFDANKFIKTMKNLAEDKQKIYHVVDTVISAKKNHNGSIISVSTENKKNIEADYFISCIGQQAFNEDVFNEEYEMYDNILLTNKAVACPINFKNEKDYHPYTVAKTMKNGWRWITPTRSRIGTGYVFSDNHISVDEATNNLLQDIGNSKPLIDPFVVDFTPRRARQIFKTNSCTIGMAAGFLEPLDAPGLAMTIRYLEFLKDILDNFYSFEKNKRIVFYNQQAHVDYDFFCSFILHQYKTCTRTDSDFWIDQKNVQFDFYDQMLHYVFDPKIYDTGKPDNQKFPIFHENVREPWMFFNSTAGKDIRWNVKIDTDLEEENIKIDKQFLFDHKGVLEKMLEEKG